MLIGSLPKDQKVDKNKGRLPYSEDGYHLSKVQYQDFVRGYTGHPFKFWIESKDKIYRSIQSDIKKRWVSDKISIKGPVKYCLGYWQYYEHNKLVTERYWCNRVGSKPVYGGVVCYKDVRDFDDSTNLKPIGSYDYYYQCPLYISTDPNDLYVEYVTTKQIGDGKEQVISVEGYSATDYITMNDGTRVYMSRPLQKNTCLVPFEMPYGYLWGWGPMKCTIYNDEASLPTDMSESTERAVIESQAYGHKYLVKHTIDHGVVTKYQEYKYAGNDTWNPGNLIDAPLPYQWCELSLSDIMSVTNIGGITNLDMIPGTIHSRIANISRDVTSASLYGFDKNQTTTPEIAAIENAKLPLLINGYYKVTGYKDQTLSSNNYIPFFGFYDFAVYPGDPGVDTHGRQYLNFAYHVISQTGLMKLNFGHDVAAIDTGETSNYIFYGGEYYEDVSDNDFDPEVFPFKVSSDGYMYATQLIKLDATSEEDVTINRVSITPLTANTLKLATVKVDGESNDICMQRIQPLIIPQGIPIAKIKYNGQDEIILVAPLSGVSSVQSNEEV